MNLIGLVVLLVGFGFPVLAESQTITCGHFLDRTFIQERCQGEDSRVEECGLRVNADQRFSPWFELTERVGEEEFDLVFVDGLANLFRFDSESAELIQLDFTSNRLNIQLNAFSGHHNRTVLLAMKLGRDPARELDGLFYQGTMSIILNYESLLKLTDPRSLATHTAAEIYRLPYACVTLAPSS